MHNSATKITINPSKICIGLTTASLLLVTLHVVLLLFNNEFNASTHVGVTALFNLNEEVSIPTWYSQSILLVSAVLLLLIGVMSDSFKKYWLGLAAIFTYISIDEGASIHELTATPIKNLLNIDSGLFYYSWVILFGGIFMLICFVYLRFYMSLPRKTKLHLIVSAAVFIGGAIGLEMVGGAIAATSGESGTVYGFVVAGEELMEMLGVAIFIYTLLEYVKIKKIKFTIS